MSDEHPPDPPPDGDDPSANTERFRAFVQREEPAPRRSVGVSFRVWTLLAGLVVFAALVWLLLRG